MGTYLRLLLMQLFTRIALQIETRLGEALVSCVREGRVTQDSQNTSFFSPRVIIDGPSLQSHVLPNKVAVKSVALCVVVVRDRLCVSTEFWYVCVKGCQNGIPHAWLLTVQALRLCQQCQQQITWLDYLPQSQCSSEFSGYPWVLWLCQ